MSTQPREPEIITITRFVNSREVAIEFRLEPWGDQFTMPPGAGFEVVARGPQGGTLEVESASDYIVVWGWVGSVLRVFHEGNELTIGMDQSLPVPAVPPGQSTREFLSKLLGD
jgi:hypothetical protein